VPADISGMLLRRTGNPDGLDGLSLSERFNYLVELAGQRYRRRLSMKQIARDISAGVGADGQTPLPEAARATKIGPSYLNTARNGGTWNPSVRILETLVAYFSPLDAADAEQDPLIEIMATRRPDLGQDDLAQLAAWADAEIKRFKAGEIPPNRYERRGDGDGRQP